MAQQPQTVYMVQTSDKNRKTALILCLLGFIGIAGLHKFYVGKPLAGLIYFFTFGIFFIGTIINLIAILSGTFKDGNDAPLKQW